MSRAVWLCRCRGGMVVLASGALISLSALTGGIAPALAAPRPHEIPPCLRRLRPDCRRRHRRAGSPAGTRLPGWCAKLRFTMQRRLPG